MDNRFEGIKSGMSEDRPKFQELIQMVIRNEVELVVIENKDRLIRFGFSALILVLNDVLENKTYEQEFTDDLISVIHYFIMKSYSHRIKQNKIRKN